MICDLAIIKYRKHKKDTPKTDILKFTPKNQFRYANTQNIPADIVVCVYNALDDVKLCLDALKKHCRRNDRVIIVDDHSNDETKLYLEKFVSDKKRFQLIRNKKNKGYTKSANIGLKQSNSPYVFLLNSDAIVGANTIAKMVECGEQYDKLGIIGPLSNAASWQTIPKLKNQDGKFLVNQIPENLDIDGVNKICENLYDFNVPIISLINGFCYAIKRSVIDKIGYLDEESFPTGYGEEDDFSIRANKAGFVCGVATNTYVFHAKSKSFTEEGRRPLAKKGLEKLKEKHSENYIASCIEVLSQNSLLDDFRNKVSGYLN